MLDLSAETADLWASLGAPPVGRARVLQLISARRGEGTSTVARELALHVAHRTGKRVWLVDLDLLGASQFGAISEDAARYGELGEAAAASPDGSVFFTVQPPARNAKGEPWPDARYLVAHRVGGAKWWVTRFRSESLVGRQTVHIRPTADYWDALRRFADVVIVDSPPPERSRAGIAVSPFMDHTVLVVAADEKDVGAPARLRDAIGSAGGAVSGLFFNRGVVERPGFLKALLP